MTAQTSRPYFADDYPDLLAHAQSALDRRVAAYPQMIAKDQIASDVASIDIQAWRLIVGEWQWIITGQNSQGAGEAPPSHTLAQRLAAIDLALERIATDAARPASPARRAELTRQQHLNMALRWHLTRSKFGAPTVHFYASLTHQCRGDVLQNGFCGTCERRLDNPEIARCIRIDCGSPQWRIHYARQIQTTERICP